MRLREFAGDKRSRKITEAAVAAVPIWMWVAGLLGIGAGVYSQQQIQNWMNNPAEFETW